MMISARRLRPVVPHDWHGRLLTCLVLVVPFWLYSLRQSLVNEAQGPRGECVNAIEFNIPLLTYLAVPTAVVLLWLIIYTLRQLYLLPAVVLVGGVLAATFVPLAVPVVPEEGLFLSHRIEYTRMVELARSGRLTHTENCQGYFFAPPAEFSQLAPQCIAVDKVNSRADSGIGIDVLVVQFFVTTKSRPILFVDDPSVIPNAPLVGGGQGCVVRQFDTNWYLYAEYPH